MEFNSGLNNLFRNYQQQQQYTKYQKASTEDKNDKSLWEGLDVNGDGKIDGTDKSKLNAEKNNLLKKENLFDVNGDGVFNQADVDMFVKGDVNGDGKITEYEMNFVSAYKNKLKTSFTNFQANFEIDGVKYIQGKLANGVVDGKYYKNGVPSAGEVYTKYDNAYNQNVGIRTFYDENGEEKDKVVQLMVGRVRFFLPMTEELNPSEIKSATKYLFGTIEYIDIMVGDKQYRFITEKSAGNDYNCTPFNGVMDNNPNIYFDNGLKTEGTYYGFVTDNTNTEYRVNSIRTDENFAQQYILTEKESGKVSLFPAPGVYEAMRYDLMDITSVEYKDNICTIKFSCLDDEGDDYEGAIVKYTIESQDGNTESYKLLNGSLDGKMYKDGVILTGVGEDGRYYNNGVPSAASVVSDYRSIPRTTRINSIQLRTNYDENGEEIEDKQVKIQYGGNVHYISESLLKGLGFDYTQITGINVLCSGNGGGKTDCLEISVDDKQYVFKDENDSVNKYSSSTLYSGRIRKGGVIRSGEPDSSYYENGVKVGDRTALNIIKDKNTGKVYKTGIKTLYDKEGNEISKEISLVLHPEGNEIVAPIIEGLDPKKITEIELNDGVLTLKTNVGAGRTYKFTCEITRGDVNEDAVNYIPLTGLDGEKMYKDGVLACKVEVDGVMYNLGKPANCTINGKKYTDGQLAQGIQSDKLMYKDGVVLTGVSNVDGKYYKNGVPSAGEANIKCASGTYFTVCIHTKFDENGEEIEKEPRIKAGSNWYSIPEMEGLDLTKITTYSSTIYQEPGKTALKMINLYVDNELSYRIVANESEKNNGVIPSIPLNGAIYDGYYQNGHKGEGSTVEILNKDVAEYSVGIKTNYGKDGQKESEQLVLKDKSGNDNIFPTPDNGSMAYFSYQEITSAECKDGIFSIKAMVPDDSADEFYELEFKYVLESQDGNTVNYKPLTGEVDGIMYKDGVPAGAAEINGVMCYDGVPVTLAIVDGKFYRHGKLGTGNYYGKTYKEGLFYKDGNLFSGTYSDGTIYKDGLLVKGDTIGTEYSYANGTSDGIMYKDGVPANDTIDGKKYVDGQLANGLQDDGVIYKDGVQVEDEPAPVVESKVIPEQTIETIDEPKFETIDGRLYKDGALVDMIGIEGKLYVEGSPANGMVDERLYQDGVLAQGNVEGIFYWLGQPFEGGYNGKYYHGGIQSIGTSVIGYNPNLNFESTYYIDGSGKLYQDGELAQGKIEYTMYHDGEPANCEIDGILYDNGREAWSIINGREYAQGKPRNEKIDDRWEVIDGKYYLEGKIVDDGFNEEFIVFFFDGVLAHGLIDGKLYDYGELANWEVKGVRYKDGVPANDTIDGKLYRGGIFASDVNDTIDGKRYVNGILAQNDIDGIMYKDGAPANDVVNGKMYKDGIPANDTIDGKLYVDGVFYKDGAPVNDKVDGIMYKDGIYADNVFIDCVYYKEGVSYVRYEWGRPVTKKVIDGIMYKDGVPANDTIDGKLYEYGKLVNREIDGIRYYQGVIADGPVDGKLYKDGVFASDANDTIDGKRYIDGILAQNNIGGTMYKDGVPANDIVNGKMYVNGIVAHKVEVNGLMYYRGEIADNVNIGEKIYFDGVLAEGVIDGERYTNGEVEPPTGGGSNPDGGTESPTGGGSNPDGGAESPTDGGSNPDGGAESPTGGGTSSASDRKNANGKIINGKMYINGKVAHKVEVDGKMYVNGIVADEVKVNGLMYKNGFIANNVEIDNKMYVEGLVANNVEVNGQMYSHGKIADGVEINGKMYFAGLLAQGRFNNGITYNKGIPIENYLSNEPYSYKKGVLSSYNENLDANGNVYKTWNHIYSSSIGNSDNSLVGLTIPHGGYATSVVTQQFDPYGVLLGTFENIMVYDEDNFITSGLKKEYNASGSIVNTEKWNASSPIDGKQNLTVDNDKIQIDVDSKIVKDTRLQLLNIMGIGCQMKSILDSNGYNSLELPPLALIGNLAVNCDETELSKYLVFDNSGEKIIGIRSQSHGNGECIWNINYGSNNKISSFSLSDAQSKCSVEISMDDNSHRIKSYSAHTKDSQGNTKSLEFVVDKNSNINSYEEKIWNPEDKIIEEKRYDSKNKVMKEKFYDYDNDGFSEKWYAVSKISSDEKILTYEHELVHQNTYPGPEEYFTYYYQPGNDVAKYEKGTRTLQPSGEVITTQSLFYSNGDCKTWRIHEYSDGTFGYDAEVLEGGHTYDIKYSVMEDPCHTFIKCKEDMSLVPSCSVVTDSSLVNFTTFEGYDYDSAAARYKAVFDEMDAKEIERSLAEDVDWPDSYVESVETHKYYVEVRPDILEKEANSIWYNIHYGNGISSEMSQEEVRRRRETDLDAWEPFWEQMRAKYPPTEYVESIKNNMAERAAMDSEEFLRAYYWDTYSNDWETGTFEPSEYIYTTTTKDGHYEGNIIASFDESIPEWKPISVSEPDNVGDSAEPSYPKRKNELENLLCQYCNYLNETYSIPSANEMMNIRSAEAWQRIESNIKMSNEAKNEMIKFIENVKSLPEEEYNKYVQSIFGDLSQPKAPSLEHLKTINSVLTMRAQYSDEQILDVYKQIIEKSSTQNSQTAKSLKDYQDSQGMLSQFSAEVVDKLGFTVAKDVLQVLDQNEEDISQLMCYVEQKDYINLGIKFKAMTGVDFDIAKINEANEAYKEYVKLLNAKNCQEAAKLLTDEKDMNNTNYSLYSYESSIYSSGHAPEPSPLEEALVKVMGSERAARIWIEDRLTRFGLWETAQDDEDGTSKEDEYQMSDEGKYALLRALFLKEIESSLKTNVDDKALKDAEKTCKETSKAAYGKSVPEEKLSAYMSNVATTKTALNIGFAICLGGTGAGAAIADLTGGAISALTAESILFGLSTGMATFIEKGTDKVVSSLGDDLLDAAVNGLLEGTLNYGFGKAIEFFPKGVEKIKKYINTKKLENSGVITKVKNVDEAHKCGNAVWANKDEILGTVENRIKRLENINKSRIAQGLEPRNFDFERIANYTKKEGTFSQIEHLFKKSSLTDDDITKLLASDKFNDILDTANAYGLFDYKTINGDYLTIEQIEKFVETIESGSANAEIKAMRELPKAWYKNMDDLMGKFGLSKPGVKEFGAETTLETALESTSVGDIVQIGDKMYLNNGLLTEWQGMNKEYFDLFFGKNMDIIFQHGIDDCASLSQLGKQLYSAENRANFLRNFQIKGDSISITLDSGTVKFKLSDCDEILKAIPTDACPGLKLYDLAVCTAALNNFKDFTTTPLLSADDVKAVINFINKRGGMAQCYVQKELYGLDLFSVNAQKVGTLLEKMKGNNLSPGIYYIDDLDFFYIEDLLKAVDSNPSKYKLSFGTCNDACLPGSHIFGHHAYEYWGLEDSMALISDPTGLQEIRNASIEDLYRNVIEFSLVVQ